MFYKNKSEQIETRKFDTFFITLWGHLKYKVRRRAKEYGLYNVVLKAS